MRIFSGWRNAGIPEIIATLGTDTEKGLDKSRARLNRHKWGKNDLWYTGSPFMFFRAESGFSAIGYIFMAVAAFSAMAFDKCPDAILVGITIFLGIILCSVMYLLAGIICYNNSKNWIPYSTVIRSGKAIRIKGTELVPGDVILLKEGDIVCADVKLIKSENLSVTEPVFTKRKGNIRKAAIGSMLVSSGESAPEDFIYAGSVVSTGSGRAVVCTVGSDTAQGKKGKLRLVSDKDPISVVNMRKKGVNAGAFAMIFAFAAIAIGAFSPTAGTDFIGMFLVFFAFAVSSGGELIPAICCLAYYVSLKDSEIKGLVVRDLAGADYITNCDGIVVEDSSMMKSNKTELKGIWVSGTLTKPKDNLGDLVISAMLTGTAYGKGKYGREVVLATSEYLAGKTDPADYLLNVEKNKPILEHRIVGSTHYSLFLSNYEQHFSVTGSIEDVISKCTKYRVDGKDIPLDHNTMARIIRSASDCLENATSIIAVATRISPYNSMKRLSVLTSDLSFIGFIALDTPAQAGLPESLDFLRAEKIPFMFFSDGGGEDINFARKLGIIKGRDDLVSADRSEDALLAVLSEESNGGVLLASDAEKRGMFLKSAANAGKRLICFGTWENTREPGFYVICGEAVPGSGAYLKKKAGNDVSPLLAVLRRNREIMSRLSTVYRYVFVSTIVRAAYSVLILFGIPFVFPSVILALGLILDAVVAGAIILAEKK